ncbi:MAG: hypothetical protein U0586_06300 [Candidatus Brocadiaceae bacterium]
MLENRLIVLLDVDKVLTKKNCLNWMRRARQQRTSSLQKNPTPKGGRMNQIQRKESGNNGYPDVQEFQYRRALRFCVSTCFS